MPLWRVFYPAGLYTADEKAGLARVITDIYAQRLPDFYVNVLFVEYGADSLYIAAEPVNDFVRFVGEHIARTMQPDEVPRMRSFMSTFEEAIAPWTAGKGVRWETHIDQTPFELWRINGLPPPPPNSEGERLWKSRGLAVPYEGMVSTAPHPANPVKTAGPARVTTSHSETSGLINAKA